MGNESWRNRNEKISRAIKRKEGLSGGRTKNPFDSKGEKKKEPPV